MKTRSLVYLLALVAAGRLHAESKEVRWTENEDKNAALEHIVDVVSAKTGFPLTVADFTQTEERDLATSHYKVFTQGIAGNLVRGASIRVWSTIQSGEAIQVEAKVENPAPMIRIAERMQAQGLNDALTNADGVKIASREVKKHEDASRLQLQDSSRVWENGELRQVVVFKAKRGKHVVSVSVTSRKAVAHKYNEFPQDDSHANEFALKANLYPIYEEAETVGGTILPREPLELKYIKSSIHKSNGSDVFAPLRERRYFWSQYDPILGTTEAGQAAGFWAMSEVKKQAAQLRAALPLVANSFENGGILLDGRYATINIHPDAPKKISGINFPLLPSAQFRPTWIEDSPDPEMIPTATLLGKAIVGGEISDDGLVNRPAQRLANHDPATYINDGFDELQVYYAVNTFMESLAQMGFADPELSTRPFNAFLFDPDISMRDNAYYTDDTINFTTYSAKAPNFARDNATIWHELGHGVMDRMMGDSIVLADTGGLSEGMADYLAALVIADKMGNAVYPGSQDFRIINNTGFHLTNEVHDDGEAYGGAMDDLKRAAIAAQGRVGLAKVTDLTLETMRLTRDNPGLTAAGWFNHMLFADSRGSDVRTKGEMHDLVVSALAGRNFSLDEGVKLASFTLKNGGEDVVSGGNGSRQNPLRVSLGAQEKRTFNLSATLSDGDAYKFKYPVTVKVFYNSGPIQGAIDWEGEDNEPKTFTVAGPDQVVPFDVTVSGTCDAANRDDGSCVDYAYVQIWNNDQAATKPVAKKRFYLRIKTQG